MPRAANRFVSVPVLSSAARMPFPGATRAWAVATSVALSMVPPRGPDRPRPVGAADRAGYGEPTACGARTTSPSRVPRVGESDVVPHNPKVEGSNPSPTPPPHLPRTSPAPCEVRTPRPERLALRLCLGFYRVQAVFFRPFPPRSTGLVGA